MLAHSLPGAAVIFPYGRRYSLRFPIRSLRGKPHIGTDYAKSTWQSLPIGTPILAPADCTQTRFRLNEKGGSWGRYVELTTKDGKFRIVYAHLEAVGIARTGKEWNKREVVGWSGNTGASTWPHCHVQMYMKRGSSWVLVDPEKYFGKQVSINIWELFQRIWGRPAAPGDELYFRKRYEQGTIKNKPDMIDKMKYWQSIVWPGCSFNSKGDNRWQREKRKILL